MENWLSSHFLKLLEPLPMGKIVRIKMLNGDLEFRTAVRDKYVCAGRVQMYSIDQCGVKAGSPVERQPGDTSSLRISSDESFENARDRFISSQAS